MVHCGRSLRQVERKEDDNNIMSMSCKVARVHSMFPDMASEAARESRTATPSLVSRINSFVVLHFIKTS
ncbi:hypothetical protein E2C01_029483 [Portunus trituberculatus]|uniref:Uncharacterized protein n=1 Tax=Portunus trituberculatus TaxID=210409 RepID=A0A5B7ESC9_PORTR|nr:hypothetical protein [Portunus trituberculatus]